MSFGTYKAPPCATCDGWLYKVLAVPQSEDVHFERDLWIPESCQRCGHFAQCCLFDRPPRMIRHRVVLPGRLINDAEHLGNMAQANLIWGSKPANAELQLANLLGGVRQEAREEVQRAYLRCADYIIRDELLHVRADKTCFEVFKEFVPCCGRVLRGTTWRLHTRATLGALSGDDGSPDSDETLSGKGGSTKASGDDGGFSDSASEPPAPPKGDSLSFDTGVSNGKTFSSSALENSAHTRTRHAHRCCGCGALYSHQHADGDKRHGQGLKDCPNPVCARYGDHEKTLAWLLDVKPPPPHESVRKAVEAEVRQEQAAAHISGATLQSTTVPTSSKTKVEGETPAKVRVPDLAVLDDGKEIGPREATTRFPQVVEGAKYVFSNGPDNLIAAEAMRNVGVGTWAPMPHEEEAFVAVVEALKTHLFSPAAIKQAMKDFIDLPSTLPKKMSATTRERILHNELNEAHMDGTPFSSSIKAFVKAEVSAKAKPRPIADHGPQRLVPIAKVAWCFEHIVAKVKFSNIKGRSKEQALKQLFSNFGALKGGQMLENDLTAFEFGVSEPLKRAEADIFRHIASYLNLDDQGTLAFQRIVDARTKAATWKMRFKDLAGAPCTVSIKLPRTMRESGDRLTSSGNWLQNVFAWFSYLCTAKTVGESIRKWVKGHAKTLVYTSSRDGKQYAARLAFEGDDTAGSITEGLTEDEMSAFFTRWGWSAKLRLVPKSGDSYLEFVGARALMCDGKPVEVDGDLVVAPPIKRLLKEKAWSTSAQTPEERVGCLKAYALVLAHEFRNVPPLHAFARAMYNDNKSGEKVSAAVENDLLMSGHGIVDLDAELAEVQYGNLPIWKRWATATAGPTTDLEWAQMCGLTTLNQHGFDLAASLPKSWLE